MRAARGGNEEVFPSSGQSHFPPANRDGDPREGRSDLPRGFLELFLTHWAGEIRDNLNFLLFAHLILKFLS